MKTTEQKNRMIADFMGQLFHNGNTFIPEHNRYIGFKNFSSFFKVSDLRYHESWDWLMPVFRTITELGISFDEEGGDLIEICSDAITDVSIVGAYQAVVQFIEWYNEQK